MRPVNSAIQDLLWAAFEVWCRRKEADAEWADLMEALEPHFPPRREGCPSTLDLDLNCDDRFWQLLRKQYDRTNWKCQEALKDRDPEVIKALMVLIRKGYRTTSDVKQYEGSMQQRTEDQHARRTLRPARPNKRPVRFDD